MMTQAPYDIEMSLLLDGLSSESEEDLLKRYQDDPILSDAYNRMSRVDNLLRSAPMAIPPAGFVASVMMGVERIERRRHAAPLLTGLIVTLALTVAVFFAIPWLFVTFNLYEPLLELPAVTAVLDFVNQMAGSFAWLADWVSDITRDWFSLLINEPSAMIVVVAALAFVSVWIGLREGVKAARVSVEA